MEKKEKKKGKQVKRSVRKRKTERERERETDRQKKEKKETYFCRICLGRCRSKVRDDQSVIKHPVARSSRPEEAMRGVQHRVEVNFRRPLYSCFSNFVKPEIAATLVVSGDATRAGAEAALPREE